MREALEILLQANEEAGTVEPGVTADDVLLLVGFLWRLGIHHDDRMRAGRLLDVVLRGLKPSGTQGAGVSPH